MNKYDAITWLNILSIILVLGIIVCAGVFKNWWLLLLLPFVSTEKLEKRILGIKENEEYD